MKYEHYPSNTRSHTAARTTCVVCGLSDVAGLVAVTPYYPFVCRDCAQGLHEAVMRHNMEVLTRTAHVVGVDRSR